MDDKKFIWLIVGCGLLYFGYKWWWKKKQALGLPLVEKPFVVPPVFKYSDWMGENAVEAAIHAARLAENY